jgi:hypothetical protein
MELGSLRKTLPNPQMQTAGRAAPPGSARELIADGGQRSIEFGSAGIPPAADLRGR